MTTAYLYSGNHFVRTQETQNGVWIRMNAPTDKELHALASALKLKIEQGAAAATIGDKKYRLILSEQRIVTISDSALATEEDEALSAFVKTVMAVTFPDYFVNVDPCDVLPIVNGADCHVVSFALETEDIPGQLAAKLRISRTRKGSSPYSVHLRNPQRSWRQAYRAASERTLPLYGAIRCLFRRKQMCL